MKGTVNAIREVDMSTKLSLFCDKALEAGWLAAIIAAPLFFNVYSSRVFEPDKLTLVRSIATTMALLWAIKLMETRLRAETGREEYRESGQQQEIEGWADNPIYGLLRRLAAIPLALPVTLLVLVYLISTAASIVPYISLFGSYQRLQGTYTTFSYIVIFALAASNIRSRAQVDRLITTAIFNSLPIALYGLIQHYALDPLPWGGDVTSRIAANMGNAIFLAAYLIMIAPLTLYRLVEAMNTILNAEVVPWSTTVKAAAYIFILAVQVISIVFARSRGPMLGFLAGLFVFMFLALTTLRQRAEPTTPLSGAEILKAFLFALGSLLGAALPVYAVFIALKKGLRWLWLSWCIQVILFFCFLVAFNMPRATFLDPLRRVPYLGQLSVIFETGGGTGKVRMLIWGGALQLISPHDPLGIPDQLTDPLNPIRPLVGYGPESMFNAFAKFYPAELTQFESRGSSADRCHNESFDALVITGIQGFLAYAFLMVSIFYYVLRWLGLVVNSAQRRLLLALLLGGIALVLATSWGLDLAGVAPSARVFMALSLPAGMIVGLFVYCLIHGFNPAQAELGVEEAGKPAPIEPWQQLALLALLAGVTAHFVESNFGISIASTRTHFWAYTGLIVALGMWSTRSPQPTVASEESAGPATGTPSPVRPGDREPTPTERAVSRRRRRRAAGLKTPAATTPPLQQGEERWQSAVMAQSLIVGIILVIMVFTFVTPEFSWEKGRYSMLWLFSITWLFGGVLTITDYARRPGFRLGWALIAYLVLSLGYTLLFAAVHWQQIHTRVTVTRPEDFVLSVSILTNALVIFYIAFFTLLFITAGAMLHGARMPATLWRSGNWWLYPPLVVGLILIIARANLAPIQADIYYKQGDSYRTQGRLQESLLLYQEAISLVPREDFYYLMLALDYQLMSQQGGLNAEQQAAFLQQGLDAAQEARDLNPYNPDNTGNLGRFYFTWAQLQDPGKYEQAKDYFRQVTYLAPQNVSYYNLWAQTLYVQGKYQEAVELYKKSQEMDNWFPQTPLFLGDAYAAMGQADEALAAHRQAIILDPGIFVDPAFEQRLNFYLSTGHGDGLLAAFQAAAEQLSQNKTMPEADRSARTGLVFSTIGYIYARQGKLAEAIAAYQQALAVGDQSVQTLSRLADALLAAGQLDQAQLVYEKVVEKDPKAAQAHSSLGYIYAKKGELEKAIQENLVVLQLSPNDYNSHKNLALLYRQLGRLDEALVEAQTALSLAPEAEKAALEGFIAQLEQQKGSGS
jgi:tetratricopeptide (TPR) repeat protein